MNALFQQLKKPLNLPAMILGVSMLSTFGASASDTDVNPSAPNITASAATKLSTTSNTVPMTPITFSNSGGTITRYEISPALSDGITLNTTSGVISGIPKESRHQTTYTVTAHGTRGSSSTALVQLTVYDSSPDLPSTIAAQTFTADTTPITPITFVNKGGPVNYCATRPALPAGLEITPIKSDLGTCEITGTPTTATPTAMYEIWAANTASNQFDFMTMSITVDSFLGAPTNLVATPVGGAVGTATADAVTLTWDAVAGATGYKVYRSAQSMAFSTNDDPASLVGNYSATSTTVTGTTHTTATLDGKTYYFFVTALKGTDESNTNSAQASAVPFATVTSPDTNRVWMSRNLGAIQECTDYKDAMCFGDFYQWGRAADGHQRIDRSATNKCWNNANPSESVDCSTLRTRTQATSITDTTPGVNFILTTGSSSTSNDWVAANVDSDGALRSAAWADGGVNDICPAGFSVPTSEELYADTVDATTGPVTNYSSAFANNFLKLPSASYRYGYTASVLSYFPDLGTFWTRSAEGDKSHELSFRSSVYKNIVNRSHALSVRCIKVIAPSLANASSVSATSGTAITDITFVNTGGAPATCTVSPDLPTGLRVDGSTCTILGVPRSTQTATTYTVTGTNSQGSDTATVSITVN